MNNLCGIEGKFLSSNSASSGVTQDFQKLECKAFGNSENVRLKLIDSPGVGDFNICLDEIVLKIKLKIGHNEVIDGALIVIKSTDYRITAQETIAIKAVLKFFSNFSSRHVFLVITHCDKFDPTDDFIAEKLEMFKRWGPLDIPPENVIKFNRTAESLVPLIERLEKSNMKFVEDLDKKAVELTSELVGDFKK